MRHQRSRLTSTLLSLSLLPLLAFGLIAALLASVITYSALRSEVRQSLNILVHTSYETYELLYPGDYSLRGGELYKGGADLNGQYGFVDGVKARTQADATLFYGDTRYLTTIRQPDGSRATGTTAEPDVSAAVLHAGHDYFSDRVLVNGTLYFGYYIPLRDTGGTAVGMLFAGKPRIEVMQNIGHIVLLLCLASLGVMAVAMTVTALFSGGLIDSLRKTEQFLGKIATGDLTAKPDAALLSRRDEIGEMGRFTVMLQQSITDLVGTDPLTGLNNRRSCDITLNNLTERRRRKGARFTVVMGDLDLFKRVNDTYGHQTGDEVLKNAAALFSSHMERLGFVFRWGGEEFLLVYEDMDRSAVLAHLEHLRAACAVPGALLPGDTVTVTFGVADCAEAESVAELIRIADQNLYLGKSRGRDCFVCSQS